jgi:hypothetical protein
MAADRFWSLIERNPWEYEEFGYVAGDVWVSVTGNKLEDFAKDRFQDDWGGEPSGTPFEGDEEYFSRHFPKLWERFGENPVG